MKALLKYSDTNSDISAATSQTLKRHLWYLSEKNVGLLLFDEEVSLSVKRRLLISKKSDEVNKDEKLEKRCNYDLKTITKSHLDSFASPYTMHLFQKLSLPMDFLDADPSSWEANQTFRAAKERLMAFQVINNHAERPIALIQQFNKALKKNEEQ